MAENENKPGEIQESDLPKSKSLASKISNLNPFYWERMHDQLTDTLSRLNLSVNTIIKSNVGETLQMQLENATSDAERTKVQDQINSYNKVKEFSSSEHSNTIEKVYDRDKVSNEEAGGLIEAIKSLTNDIKKLESVTAISSETLRDEQTNKVGDTRISSKARADAVSGYTKDISTTSSKALLQSPEMASLLDSIGIDVADSIEKRVEMLDDPRYMKKLAKKLKSNKRTDVVYDALLRLGAKENALHKVNTGASTSLTALRDKNTSSADLEYLLKDLLTSMDGLPEYMKQTAEINKLLEESQHTGEMNQDALGQLLNQMIVDTTPERSLRSLEELNRQMDKQIMTSNEMLDALEENNLADKFKENADKMAEGAKGTLKTLLGGLLGAIAPGLGDLVDVGGLVDSVFDRTRGGRGGRGGRAGRGGLGGKKPGLFKRIGQGIKGGAGKLFSKVLPAAAGVASVGSLAKDGIKGLGKLGGKAVSAAGSVASKAAGVATGLGGKMVSGAGRLAGLAGRAGMVGAAGAAGYGAGTLLNDHVINPGMEKLTGTKGETLGSWVYDKVNGEEDARKLKEAEAKAKADWDAKHPKPAQVPDPGKLVNAEKNAVLSTAEKSGKIVGGVNDKAIGQAVQAGEDATLKSGKLASKGKNLVASVKKIPGAGAIKALGRVAGKLALPLAVLTTALDAKEGWDNAGEILGKAEEDLTTGDKAYAATLSGISGLTLGIADPKMIDSGFKAIGSFFSVVDDNTEVKDDMKVEDLTPEQQAQKKAEMEDMGSRIAHQAINATAGVPSPADANKSAVEKKAEQQAPLLMKATATPADTSPDKINKSTSQTLNNKVTAQNSQAGEVVRKGPEQSKNQVPLFLRAPQPQQKPSGGARAPISFNDADTTLASGALL